jgi:hypothetical protein
VGHWVERLRGQAATAASYYPLYGLLALLVLLSLAGLPCLHAIGRREHVERTSAEATPLSALH